MNKGDLINKIAEDAGLTKTQASAALDAVTDGVTSTLAKGDKLTLVGFGTFTKVKRAARTGVNPATGEKIKIKAKTLPKFRPGKAWKEMF